MKKLALTAVVSSALVASAVVQADPGQFFLTPFVGVQKFDSSVESDDVKDDTIWGVGGEYQFSNHFGVELDYTRGMDDLDVEPGVTAEYDRLSLDGIYYFSPTGTGGKVVPYAKLGAGHSRYDYDFAGASDDQATHLDAGVGLRINFTDHFSLRPEIKYIHELDESLSHTAFTLGFGFAFGGASKPAPVAAAPAPAVVAPPPAPVDSDGDGVYDDKDKCPNTARGLEVDADGCEFHLTKTEEVRLEIKFANNKADITDDYVGEVERVAKFMKKYASANAEIAGHTDSTASDAYNQKLSQRRADAVKTMLVTRFGIDAARLTAVGYGESKPIASNDTAEGRAQNRRVVAVMHAETTETVKKK
ncbi:MAG: OmpA family protein [Spongiibacteraceae bacterium]